jgi:SAM-dependent methyltransferase
MNKFSPEVTPSLISFIVLEKGFYPPPLEKFNYCELGCGDAFTINLLAASNPEGQFWAVDDNPSNIAKAKLLAEGAQSRNIHFCNQSFEEFSTLETPLFDFIILNEVYSFLTDENRHLVIEIIRKKLKLGGVVYINYYALPGLATIMPLQELMFQYTEYGTGPKMNRIEQAILFIDKLYQLSPQYFVNYPDVVQQIKEIRQKPLNYVVNEYFSNNWHSYYHFEIAKELAKAKLTFISSMELTDKFNYLILQPEQYKFLTEIADLPIYETIRDYFFNRRFRQDIFIKGPVKLTKEQQAQFLSNLKFTLIKHPQEIKYELKISEGTIQLQKEIYHPLVMELYQGFPDISGLMAKNWPNNNSFKDILQSLTMLISNGSAMPVLSTYKPNKLPESSINFNSAVLKQVQLGEQIQALVSPVIGTGFSIARFEQLFLLAYQLKLDPVAFVWDIFQNTGERFQKYGQIMKSPEDNQEELSKLAQKFLNIDLPVLKKLEIS